MTQEEFFNASWDSESVVMYEGNPCTVGQVDFVEMRLKIGIDDEGEEEWVSIHDCSLVLPAMNDKDEGFKLQLGIEVKDKVTGFQGIITGATRWLTGCDQYIIKPEGVTDQGKMKASEWMDEGRLEKVSDGVHNEVLQVRKKGSFSGETIPAKG